MFSPWRNLWHVAESHLGVGASDRQAVVINAALMGEPACCFPPKPEPAPHKRPMWINTHTCTQMCTNMCIVHAHTHTDACTYSHIHAHKHTEHIIQMFAHCHFQGLTLPLSICTATVFFFHTLSEIYSVSLSTPHTHTHTRKHTNTHTCAYTLPP